jgi:DNA-binding winged helix-turn-helix (wHTH) protein/TolB-like protein/Flp pilus assembly protein TadD
MAGPTYSFEDFQIDAERSLLVRKVDGSTVTLTNKAFQVLLTLVEKRGELVSKGDLMTAVWRDSFVEEANLTQTVSQLRKALGENPSQHRFIVTESGKGYRFVAPVQEHNGNGHAALVNVPAAAPEAADPERTELRNTALYALVAIVMMGLAIAGVYYLSSRSSPLVQQIATSQIKALAVLPFHEIEPGDDSGQLGAGMADALIARLSHIEGVTIRQPSRSARRLDATPEAISVGRQINVDAVLEGTIHRADGRIRVAVRLFQVSDGSLLWAENFDEREAEIFAVHDAISERVVRSLSLKLNGEAQEQLTRRSTDNVEAYHLYNKGRLFWNKRTSDDLRKSVVYYEEAIARDPNYALAYAGIAETYVLLQKYSPSHESEVFEKAREAAEKALSIDPNLAEARTALALYKEQAEWKWDEAETEFRKAIESNPNYPTARQWYGEFLAFRGRFAESIAQTEAANELDPLSLSTNTARAFPYLVERRYEDVIAKLQPAMELDSDFPQALYYLARSYEGLGQYDKSLEYYDKAIAISGPNSFFVSAKINALARKGDLVEAERTFKTMVGNDKVVAVSRYAVARALAALGRHDQAISALEQAFERRDPLLAIINVDPNFDEMKSDARFQSVLHRIGF